MNTDLLLQQKKGGFGGIGGFEEMMTKLKHNGKPLCRIHVYCLSDDCKSNVNPALHYGDLTGSTGGGNAEDDESADTLVEFILAPNSMKDKISTEIMKGHIEAIERGERKELAYIDAKKNCSV